VLPKDAAGSHAAISYRSHPIRARRTILRCTNPLERAPAARRILVIRLGALGDVVRTLPALRALREAYPDARIDWLVESRASGPLDREPALDGLLYFPRESLSAALRGAHLLRLGREVRAFSRELCRRNYDLVLDFHGILKSGVLSRISGAALRVGYAPPYGRELAWLFANRRAILEPRRASRFERNLGLLHFLGLEAKLPQPPLLEVDPGDFASMRTLLGEGEAPLLIHPGSSAGTPYKRYAIADYASALREVHRRSGRRCVVAWGPTPGEREQALELVALGGPAAALAPETRSFADLAALLATSAVFIGSDSGPLHVASLLGTPVVQILGPTDPVENAPYPLTPSRSLRVPLPCSPCRRGCAAATCMRSVAPAAVAAAALALLDARPPEWEAAG